MPRGKFWLRLLGLFLFIGVGLLARALGWDRHLSLATLVGFGQSLRGFVDTNGHLAAVWYVLLHTAVAACAIPGSSFLSLASGYLFGPWLGVVLTTCACTSGSMILVLVTRHLLGVSLQRRLGPKLARLNAELDEAGYAYLLSLRLNPLISGYLLNIAAGLTKVSPWTFLWTTAVGGLPTWFVWVFAGSRITTVTAAREMLKGPAVWAMVLLGVVGTLPLLARWLERRREGEQTSG